MPWRKFSHMGLQTGLKMIYWIRVEKTVQYITIRLVMYQTQEE